MSCVLHQICSVDLPTSGYCGEARRIFLGPWDSGRTDSFTSNYRLGQEELELALPATVDHPFCFLAGRVSTREESSSHGGSS